MGDLNVSYMSIDIGVAALAIAVLLLDLFLPREQKGALGWVAGLGLAALLAASFLVQEKADTALGGLYLLDGFAIFFKKVFAIIGILIVILARGYIQRIDDDAQGEFYVLGLFALVGMMLVASVGDFMSLFVSLELITVSFYVLVAFKRTDALSVEAGLKYIILGALASGFLLFGIALLFGATGQVQFALVRNVLQASPDIAGRVDFLLGAILIVSGLGFKIAAVPFHVWAPDVYMGAPTPVTAFLSVGSKAAGFILLLRVVTAIGGAMGEKLSLVLAILAAITVFYGNLAAIPQRNIKRLLGYSTIGHAGYLLMGVAVMDAMGTSAVLYYLLGYVFTNLAAFFVIVGFSTATRSHAIEAYAGLSKRSPMMAACLTISMLSLAGIPPLAGFFGKFLVLAAVAEKMIWLVAVGAVNVVISMYYYLCVIKAMYVHEPKSEEPVTLALPLKVALIACVVLIMVIGIFQGPFVDATMSVARALAASF
jgi:NADH-quinone oxidoreductase subunit N